MKALNHTAIIAAMGFLLAVSLTTSITLAGTSYSITDLGTLGGTTSVANGINDSGQVVGRATDAHYNWHAFLYSGSTMTVIGSSGESSYDAGGINASGQVVGYSNTGQVFLYSGSTVKDLPILSIPWGSCSINASGQIVGCSVNTEHAFLYSGSTMKDLGSLGGVWSQAFGINDRGQVVGYSDTAGNAASHAFLYSGSTMADLGTLGGKYSRATGTNNSGQVVGGSSNTDNLFRAFLYSGSTMVDLGTLGGGYSAASGINDRGQVVGCSDTAGNAARHAFLYSGSTMTDINSLIPSTSGWTVTDANAINSRGQIAANATGPDGESHAVLLTPVFTALSQNDPLWKDISYAGTSDKIGGLHSKGCALTSLAMALTGAGISEDPAMLNSLMLAKGGYNNGGNVDWGTAVKVAANAASAPDVTFHGFRSSATADLDKLLSQGHPVIVGVNPGLNSEGQRVWGHFVVVTGKQGSTYTIADPGYSGRTTLDAYNNVFETRGYVADPPDVSEINISVVAPGNGVNLLLTDSHGNKTGIDGSGGRFELIPGSVHFMDAIAGVDSDQPPTEASQYVHIELPELGDYGIEIRGIDADPTSYNLIQTAFAADGSELWHKEIAGVVAAGSVDQYTVNYAVPEPASLGLLAIGAVAMLRRRRAA